MKKPFSLEVIGSTDNPPPRDGQPLYLSPKVIIAALDGERTVKRLPRRNGRVFLAPANPDYAAIGITEREHVHAWGVVTYAIHKV